MMTRLDELKARFKRHPYAVGDHLSVEQLYELVTLACAEVDRLKLAAQFDCAKLRRERDVFKAEVERLRLERDCGATEGGECRNGDTKCASCQEAADDATIRRLTSQLIQERAENTLLTADLAGQAAGHAATALRVADLGTKLDALRRRLGNAPDMPTKSGT